jgi:magnesium transporter
MNTEAPDRHTSEPFQILHALLTGDEPGDVRTYLTSLAPADAVRALLRLDEDEQNRLIGSLSADQAAALLEDLPDSQAAGLIKRIDIDTAAEIVGELPSDHGADLLSALDTEDADAILKEMSPSIAREVRNLIEYPADVAGGLMGAEHHACPESALVGEFLGDLAKRRERHQQLPQRIVLLDTEQRPTGAVEVADLLTANRDQAMARFKEDVDAVLVTATLDELEAYFDRYETLGAPVIDVHGRLVGRLRRRAVEEALTERAQSDQLKTQGIVGGEELRAMPLLLRSKRRLSWLSINILLNVVAASVIALFQDTVSAVIALAVFLPIVSDMSGCSGNQAVAVSMRELTLGIIKPRDLLRVWWQEASVGLLNGVALGLLLSMVAFAWQGSPILGVVVGLALCLNTIIAVSIGGVVPLILRAWHADPAAASGPVLTTVTDICGFFLLLGLATIALPWLT